jgi:hypothetical protein
MNTPVHYERKVLFQNTAGAVSEYHTINGSNILKVINTYNSSGLLETAVFTETSDGVNDDTISKLNVEYNAQNKPSKYMIDMLFGLELELLYNASNLLETVTAYTVLGPLKSPFAIYSFTYYNDNSLKTIISYDYDGVNTIPGRKDSLGYDSTPFYTTLTKALYTVPIGWDEGVTYVKTLNAQNLPDTMREYATVGGSIVQLNKLFAYTYDINGNPLTEHCYDYTTGTPVLEYYKKHYYDNGGLSVNELNEKMIETYIYPNPANDKLNIEFAEPIHHGIRIFFYNLTGQLVQRINFSGTIEQHLSIPIQDLVPGTYILEIQNYKGQKIHAQEFMKK